MIITVTPNPSIDRTLEIPSLALGEVNRADHSRVDAGGKGINVSRALAAHGTESVAVYPRGGNDGRLLDALLSRVEGVRAVAVPVRQDTRSNLTIAHDSGSTTKLNAPGPVMEAAELEALTATVLRAVDETAAAGPSTATVVACGSLPPGVGTDYYARLAEAVTAAGARFVLDTSGEALSQTIVDTVAQIWLIKPNLEELSELVNRPLVTVADVVTAVKLLGCVDNALVSLGSLGALLVSRRGVWLAQGEPIVARSSVGAGDSMLAGFLHAVGDPVSGAEPDFAEVLKSAAAWGQAAVRQPGTAVPGPGDVEGEVTTIVENPDRSLRLAQ